LVLRFRPQFGVYGSSSDKKVVSVFVRFSMRFNVIRTNHIRL
jgi:hypothetical protein